MQASDVTIQWHEYIPHKPFIPSSHPWLHLMTGCFFAYTFFSVSEIFLSIEWHDWNVRLVSNFKCWVAEKPEINWFWKKKIALYSEL
jgi:hypothetical protein